MCLLQGGGGGTPRKKKNKKQKKKQAVLVEKIPQEAIRSCFVGVTFNFLHTLVVPIKKKHILSYLVALNTLEGTSNASAVDL